MQIEGALSHCPLFFEFPKVKKIIQTIVWIATASLAFYAIGWHGLVGCALVFGSIQICSPPTPESSTLKINPNEFKPQFTNTNKYYAYRLLTQREPLLETAITLEKVYMPQEGTFLDHEDPLIQIKEGAFSYPGGIHDWTANFGDERIFFGSVTGLLAQDELQALEHPALSHVYTAIQNHPTFGRLDLDGSALLVEGARRYGELKHVEELYGNAFAKAPLPTITVHGYEEPKENNLFVFVAPRIPSYKAGQPYRYEDLRALFDNAYTAFSAIVKRDADAVIHTGNWGCGAFGNDPKTVALIQFAAAKMAGVRNICYYPLEKKGPLNAGLKLFHEIHPKQGTREEFLRDVESHAADYGLVYRYGNGT